MRQMEQKPLKDFICEKLEAKGFNLEKIFQATGIPKHYLESILKGEWHKLPAAPYTKGYFKKLESILELESGSLWHFYQDEAEIKVSGSLDKLPENRYAIKNNSRKLIFPILAIFFLGIYLVLNATRLLGIPKLTITSPLNETVISTLPTILLAGEINSKDKLTINSEDVYVDEGGKFQENYKLQAGLNTFEIVAKRFLGKESKVFKQIIYQPTEENKN